MDRDFRPFFFIKTRKEIYVCKILIFLILSWDFDSFSRIDILTSNKRGKEKIKNQRAINMNAYV
jgi:hypothetical protein